MRNRGWGWLLTSWIRDEEPPPPKATLESFSFLPGSLPWPDWTHVKGTTEITGWEVQRTTFYSKKVSFCFKQNKGHNTKHSGVSCFSRRRCTNKQVSWIIHKQFIFAFTDNRPFFFLSTPILLLHSSPFLFTSYIHYFHPQNPALWAPLSKNLLWE